MTIKDLDDLAQIHSELLDLKAYEIACMVELYNQGYSWGEIAEVVGMTRQGARQKAQAAGYKMTKRMTRD